MNTALPAVPPAPSTFGGRVKNALHAVRGLNKDPNRLDLVFVLGEAVNRRAFPRVWARFEGDPEGARVLAERPEIDSAHVDIDALERLPDGTLGREYARFIKGNGLSLDVFRAPVGVDPRAAYLMQRMRQTHDLWHVITGYSPDVRGEVLLQAFTYAQARIPSAAMIALFGTVRITLRVGPSFLKETALALRRGRRAKFFGPLYWEALWSEPVESLRARLECPALASAA
jgi:ubiquinone biosynthesis protein COQ4